MPKSVLKDIITHKDENDFVSNVVINISYELSLRHMTVKELSKKSGIPESTLRLRLNDPGSMKQSEIAQIAKTLKISPFFLVGHRLKYIKEE